MLIATIMGSLIGSERKSHGFEIGGRTYALVALGAAVVTSFARDVFGENAPHIIAGVLTGIGFLGAGVIIKQLSEEVRGLTTATSIWATAVMGIVIGGGYLIPGVFAFFLILMILSWKSIQNKLSGLKFTDSGKSE